MKLLFKETIGAVYGSFNKALSHHIASVILEGQTTDVGVEVFFQTLGYSQLFSSSFSVNNYDNHPLA